SADPKDLHHLVAEVIDHLDRNPAGLRDAERSRGIAVKRRPSPLIDLGFKGGLERLVGVASSEKVSLPDKKALFVVVGIDKPASDALGAVAASFPCLRMEYVDAFDFDLNLPVARRHDVDVGLSKDHEEVTLAGILQVAGHV